MFARKKNITVTASRTLNRDYQSKVAGFTVEVPDGVAISDALDLLDFMIEARLFKRYESLMKEKYRSTYAACFPGEELSDFLKLVDGQPYVEELDYHEGVKSMIRSKR